MANTSDLVEAFARIDGITSADANQAVHSLQDAGRWPKGRRGRGGAAKVSARHAADLLTVFLSTAPLSMAARTAEVEGSLPLLAVWLVRPDGQSLTFFRDTDAFEGDQFCKEWCAPTFGEMLCRMIEGQSGGVYRGHFLNEVSLSGGRQSGVARISTAALLGDAMAYLQLWYGHQFQGTPGSDDSPIRRGMSIHFPGAVFPLLGAAVGCDQSARQRAPLPLSSTEGVLQ